MLNLRNITARVSCLRKQTRSFTSTCSNSATPVFGRTITPIRRNVTFSRVQCMNTTGPAINVDRYFDDLPPARSPSLDSLGRALFDDEEIDMDKMLILRKAAAANPDLQFMDEKKLQERIGALSMILLQPSCYRAFLSRHVNLSLRENKNIPPQPPASASPSAPFHPLVRHLVLRHPELLRRRDYDEAISQLTALFPKHDVMEIIGRYPPILSLDLSNRVQQKLFYLTNIFDNAEDVTALLAAQPDILHVKTEMLAPRRMDALADYLGLSNDQVLAFVKDFPRFISPTLPSRDVQRLAVFRMEPPALRIDAAATQRLKRDAGTARDLVAKLAELATVPEADGKGAAWRDHFSSPRALLRAVKLVVLSKDTVFKALFPDFANARRAAHSQREQRAGSRAGAGHRELRDVVEGEGLAWEQAGVEVHSPAGKEDAMDLLRGRQLQEAELAEDLVADGPFSTRVREAETQVRVEHYDEAAAHVQALEHQNRESSAGDVFDEVYNARMRQDAADVYRPTEDLELPGLAPQGMDEHVVVQRKVKAGMRPQSHEEPEDVAGQSAVHESRAALHVVERDAARERMHAYRGPSTNTPVEEDHGEMPMATGVEAKLRLELKHQGRELQGTATDAIEEEEAARARRALRKKERSQKKGVARRDMVEQSWYGSEPHGPQGSQ